VSGDVDFVSWQFVRERFVDGFRFRVEKMTLKFPGVERGESKHLSFLRKSQAIDIDFRILVNKLGFLRGLGIDQHDGRFVAIDVRTGVNGFVIKSVKLRGALLAEIRGQHALEFRTLIWPR